MNVCNNDLSSVIKKPENFTSHEIDCWRSIQLQSHHLQNVFLSYSFCRAVSSVHPHVYVCMIKDSHEIIAFFPFQFKDRFHENIGVAERLGGDLSDYFGVIAKSDFVVSFRELSRLCGINYMHYTHLDQSQINYGFSAEAPEKALLVDIGNSSDEYFQQLRDKNKKLFNDTLRQIRKIEKDVGSLSFSFNVDSKKREETLKELIVSKREQYLLTRVEDSLSNNWKRELLYKLASLDEKDCKGVLSALYAGETWAAYHFGVQCNGSFHYWFPVYNPKISKYSPGRLLLWHLISESSLQSPFVTSIDMGAGISKAKTDFANAEHIYYRGEISKPGMITFSYKAFSSIKWRLQALRK